MKKPKGTVLANKTKDCQPHDSICKAIEAVTTKVQEVVMVVHKFLHRRTK